MSSQILFQAVPAYVMGLNNPDQSAAIWCGTGGSPTGSSSTVDLFFQRSLTKIGDKLLAQYDDLLTEITPHSIIGNSGAVYYAVNYSSPTFSTCVSTGGWAVPSGNQPYQYMCWALVDDNGSIVRYHGFKVQVVGIQGVNVFVDIYGVSDPTAQKSGIGVQLDSTNCLPASYDLTNMVTNSTVSGAVGALYFSDSFITAQSLAIPKLPPGLGTKHWPSVRH